MPSKNKNTIDKTHPHLLEEWDYAKNGNLRPEDFTYGSGKRVWWLCKDCGSSWAAFIYRRTGNKNNCLICGEKNRVVLYLKAIVRRSGSLYDTNPELLEEWDFKKNKLKPGEISPGSGKKVWWVCSKCGYSWKAFIFNRARKDNPRGCSACSGRVTSENNNLAVKFPDLCKEWDYEKNLKSPSEVAPCSNDKVWWVCLVCGYKWKTCVYVRTRGRCSGCPKCSKRPVSSIASKWLDSLNIFVREYHIKFNKKGKRGFRVDGFDPETNTVYEFLGDYWHGNPEVFSSEEINPSNKKSYGALYKEALHRLRLLEESGFNVVYIWENDFNMSQDSLKTFKQG